MQQANAQNKRNKQPNTDWQYLQDELEASDEQPLRAVGVKGGDLLWLVGPATSTSGSMQLPPSALMQPGPSVASIAQQPAEAPREQGSFQTEASEAHSMPPATSFTRPAWSNSDIFARVQAANPLQTDPLRCAGHAAALEIGLTPTWQV